MENSLISLEHGNGGSEMQGFLQFYVGDFYRGNDWSNFTNDGATFPLSNGDHLCFTTDSYVVSPVKFPGGNIGHLAFSGTVNDLAVMGADPLGISLSLVLEEGFSRGELDEILSSIKTLSSQYKIPVVTGDTKVMEKGAIDKVVINTSGIGMAKRVLNESLKEGDKIIISGGIGEHGVALLSQRFDFQTEVVSDSKPLVEEMMAIRDAIKCAKDPTRGGISAALNEIAGEEGFEIEVWKERIPVKKAVQSATQLLGIDPFELANEGRIICFTSSEKSDLIVEKLRKFNSEACVIGEVKQKLKMGKVVLKTDLGSRVLVMPSGQIVPRIC